jgi:hypothetical protein
MAVWKFRSVDEMSAAPLPAAAGIAFDRFVRHCSRYRALAPHLRPRGVFKFRTIAEAQRARELIPARPTPGARRPSLPGGPSEPDLSNG